MAKRRSRSLTARARPNSGGTCGDEPLTGKTPAKWWDHVPPQIEIVHVNPEAVNFPVSETPEMRACRARLGFIAKFRNTLNAEERAIAHRMNPVVSERWKGKF